MSDNQFFIGILVGAAAVVIFSTTSHLVEKNKQQRDEIEKLISRLEECEKTHELKNNLFNIP